jgi:hypothetical protein
VQNQLLAFTGAGGLNGWVRHPHAARPGFEPLELYKP